MKITSITVKKEEISIAVSGAQEGGTYFVDVLVPVVCGNPDADWSPARIVAHCEPVCHDMSVSVPRFCGEYDCIICAFEVSDGKDKLKGVRYVTEIDEKVPEYDMPYPKKTIKALMQECTVEEIDLLGIQQASISVNQAMMMTLSPAGAIEYTYNGRSYYFKKDVVEKLDAHLRAFAERGVMCVMRYINSPFFWPWEETADDDLVDIILHPDHDNDSPTAHMSAFNVRTEQGIDYFCACTEFLVERYAREDQKYGCCLSYEMGNEVDSHSIWNNAGEMTCEQFISEYTTVIRLAWLLASKHYANFRVHTSFDQCFGAAHNPLKPKGFFAVRKGIEAIAAQCAADGDFPWNVAFHPYPEKYLSHPDFYHDRGPKFSFETKKITFKNIEVMPAFLAQQHLLYKGQPRRIILPEQGFNTRDGEPYTEYEAAHGYCLAYLKIRNLPTIDMFLHYSYMDNPWEFGLNLGIRRFRGYDEKGGQIAGEPKPIYWVLRDMDTPAEAGRIRAARDFIGPELFDRLLDPPEITEALDHSRKGLKGKRKNKRSKIAKEKKEQNAVNFDA